MTTARGLLYSRRGGRHETLTFRALSRLRARDRNGRRRERHCADGKFGAHVENGQPTGDAKDIAAAHKAIYWVDIANTGEATQVTLVWTLDGKEVQRQSLDVGRSPHWRTWGARLLSGARTIGVQVLDASGKSLKEDSITLEGG